MAALSGEEEEESREANIQVACNLWRVLKINAL